MRLACDEMLQRLGRWLRAAGYDTFLAAGGLSDEAMLRRCREEGRALLTRDRDLAAATGVAVVVLKAIDLEGQADEAAAALALDWSHAPFTRCVEDNTPLRPADADEIARMPQTAQGLPGPFQSCPCCGRLYWPGSHVRRMRARLEALAAAQARRT